MTDVDLRNAITSAKQRLAFLESRPDRESGYMSSDQREFQTWTGERLGRVTRLGAEYKGNFGDRRRQITVLGDNGRTYYGISLGGGMCCNLRAKKG